jgi:hypothetical protein
MHARPPHLQDVLADVRRGRVAYICLTREQKKALRDPEARIALDVLRHLLGARPMTPERSPLTEQTFQAVARRLGYVVARSAAGAWCVACPLRAWSCAVAITGSRTATPPPAPASVSPSTSLATGCALPALISESVLSAGTRLSRPMFARAGGRFPSSGLSRASSVGDTALVGAADEVTR